MLKNMVSKRDIQGEATDVRLLRHYLRKNSNYSFYSNYMAQQGFGKVFSRSVDNYICVCMCDGKWLEGGGGAQGMDRLFSRCQHSTVSFLDYHCSLRTHHLNN